MNTPRSIYLASFLVALGFVGLLVSCGKAPSPVSAAPAAPVNVEATFSPEKLAERTLHRRAIEAVSWGMPVVNFDRMYQAFVAIRGGPNQIVYWSRPFGWKNQTLTPNPDTLYFMPFYDVRNGPVVLEIPPAGEGVIVGSIDDAWQTAIEDVGPAGADKGKGGKYLILPPGHKDPVPGGYIALRSETYSGFALLRSNLKSRDDAGVAAAVAYAKQLRLYPLSKASDPPETVFIDAIDVEYDATIPYDMRFFESLDRMVQNQPWLTRDKAMIDLLESIGIEKGKPFAPGEKTRAVLEDAAREAHAWMEMKYEEFFPPMNQRARWALPASPDFAEAVQNNYSNPDSYPVDARGRAYSYAFFSAKHLGTGQYYLMTIRDRDGRLLDGAKNYRLTVPANAPVNQYWSATAYDRATHALIRDSQWSSRGSQSPGIQSNPDGSVDVFFGPQAPDGKQANWVPTQSAGGFEVLFRFYGPEKALFDKSWVLPDIEAVP